MYFADSEPGLPAVSEVVGVMKRRSEEIKHLKKRASILSVRGCALQALQLESRIAHLQSLNKMGRGRSVYRPSKVMVVPKASGSILSSRMAY